MIATDKKYNGFWVMHDDTLLNMENIASTFDPAVPYVISHNDGVAPGNFTLAEAYADKWAWFRTTMGVPSMQAAIDKSKGTKFELSYESKVWGSAQSDIFYVPWDDRHDFAEAAAWLGDSMVFLEIAVPYIFWFILRNTKCLPLCTSWLPARLVASELVETCNPDWIAAHPVKMGKDYELFRRLVMQYSMPYLQNGTGLQHG
eukprot:Selendium_serpulae@DN6352_c0_g2_i4.p2